MAVLALLLPDANARARAASALDGDHRVIHAPSWALLQRLVVSHPVDLCLLDLHDPFRPISLQQLQRFRRKHPDLAILVYGDFDGKASELFDLGRLQVDGVLQVTGFESRQRLRRAVHQALARSTSTRVLRALDAWLPSLALDCLGWSVEHAESSPRVDDLAVALGLDARVLGRDLREQSLPAARTLLLWGRLLQAARLLESRGATVDQVAFRVGYATGGALRRALKRHCGVPPGRLTREGGLSLALEAFLERFAAAGPPGSVGRRRRSWATGGIRHRLR